jgi:hypothetical protein
VRSGHRRRCGVLARTDHLWASVETTREAQLARYDAVIHLRTPSAAGYNHSNPVRVETAAEALAIDERIARAWDGHPRRYFVERTKDFIAKARIAVKVLRDELPECCRRHLIPSLDGEATPG